MTHLTFERLSELAELGPDGGGSARDEESRHLASCGECRAAVSRVRSLLVAAQALPRDVAPPPEVWAQLRSRVADGRVRSMSASHWGRWLAAAASVVFIAGAALLLPDPDGDLTKAKATTGQFPPAIGRVESHFTETLAELRATLDTQRPQYAPAGVAVVDRTLAVIDTAIAETRAALTDDPNNPALVEILSSHYERKVELLQRATELGPSS